MRIRSFVVVALAFVSSQAAAMPVVDGFTISWPDDGWYQVQSLPDYESVCSGGTSCVVDAGNYNVINHTTGERFENITVPTSTSSSDVSQVTVTGNTISWPDDGWYQVQNASTYESVCEGGTQCDVADGSYNVINLSTGFRVEALPVGGSSGQSGSTIDQPVLNGLTLQLPDNGWYQVQDSTDYTTICEGETLCQLQSGTYTAINHSTGERWESLQVPAVSNSTTPSDPVASSGPMTFLSNLGEPPYANLPLVHTDPAVSNLANLPDRVRSNLPEDCMLDQYGLYFCYQPSTRLLQSLLNTGEPFWSFNLPGSNRTNRIDGVRLTLPNRLAVVANVTTEFGSPRHEVSFFTSRGEFIETREIFNFEDLAYPHINIQGEPLIVSGASKATLFGVVWNLELSGNTYELVPGGNRANPSDWRHTGTITASLDGLTGEYSGITLCSGKLIDNPQTFERGCADRDSSNIYANTMLRNNAAGKLSLGYQELNDGMLQAASRVMLEFRNATRTNGLVTDLGCDPERTGDDCSLVPSVGDRVRSSTAMIECTVPDSRILGVGDAELTQRLMRVSGNRIRLADEYVLGDRCSLEGVGWHITGAVSVLTELELSSGTLVYQQVLFNDVMINQPFGRFYRFYDGAYSEQTAGSSNNWQLNSARIDRGGICNRSCLPNPITAGRFENISLDMSEAGSGNYTHRIDSTWVITAEAPNEFSGQPQIITSDFSFDASTNRHIGYLQMVDRDGSSVRVTPVDNASFPTLPHLQYQLTNVGGEQSTWSLPARGFPNTLVRSFVLAGD